MIGEFGTEGWGGSVAGKPLGKGILGSSHSDSLPPTPGEACWWTMHPASKQRSEGEKVRVGDDLILVSVSSERYLVSNPTPSQLLLPQGWGAPPGPPTSSSSICGLSGPHVLTPDSKFPDLWHPLLVFGAPCPSWILVS